MRDRNRHWSAILLAVITAAYFATNADLRAQETASPNPITAPGSDNQPDGADGDKPQNPPPAQPEAAEEDEISLAEDQAVIKEQFRRFEKSMLDMAEFIRKTEPERADILIRAINNSKENGVFRDMEDLVKLLASEDQLGDAVDRQDEVVDELQALLELLMSDDREKELAKEKARIEQYIKDLTKIIAGQKDVHAATDRDAPAEGLTPRQEKLAEKTAELKKLIEDEDEKAKSDKANSGEQPMPSGDESEPGKPKNSDPQNGEPDPKKPHDKKPDESKPDESKPGESKPGESEEGESQPSDQQPPSEKKQAREQLEKARDAMEKAIKKLEKDQKKDASADQEEALQELQKAKEKLEEILRQIREQERLLQLVGLEARFQRMLAQQIAIYNDTVQIDKVAEAERTNVHQLKSEELSQQESELVLEANKSLTLLQEEGTAVAFPEAVEQMRFDMQTLVDHLKRQQVGQLTQAIEMDVINGLKEMIDALQEQQEKEKEKQQDKQQPQEGEGEPQDDELLKQISELKMLKALQVRINNRTTKLSQLYTGEQATRPEVVQQVRELSIRQARIQKATYDLSTGKNK